MNIQAHINIQMHTHTHRERFTKLFIPAQISTASLYVEPVQDVPEMKWLEGGEKQNFMP